MCARLAGLAGASPKELCISCGHELGQRSCWAVCSHPQTRGSQHISPVQVSAPGPAPHQLPFTGGPCPQPQKLCCPKDEPWPGYSFPEGSGDGGLAHRHRGDPVQQLCLSSGAQAAMEGGGLQAAAPSPGSSGAVPRRGLCAAPGGPQPGRSWSASGIPAPSAQRLHRLRC